MSMQDSPQKRSIWMRIHIDPLFMLIILGLLTYSAVVIWSASGQDPGMMERKLGQIAMGLVIMIVLAQVPPRVYERLGALSLYCLRHSAGGGGCLWADQ